MNDESSSFRHEVKFRLNRDEVAEIDQIATQLNMTRNALMTHMLRKAYESKPQMHESIFVLKGLNNDMGRAGHLLKMWLIDDPMTKDFRIGTVLSILQRIAESKIAMKSIIQALRLAYEKHEVMEKKALPKTARMSVKFRLVATDVEKLSEMSKGVGLSRNEFLSRLMTFRHIPSQSDIELLQLLFKINGDLGRVGGLLKMWLSDPKSLFHFNTGMIRQHLLDLEAVREEFRLLLKVVKKNCCIN